MTDGKSPVLVGDWCTFTELESPFVDRGTEYGKVGRKIAEEVLRSNQVELDQNRPQSEVS